MRELSETFMKDLKEGMLSSILDRVKQDDTLMLAIRKNYINIYYRGGNLLKLTEQSKNCYETHFDSNYNKTDCPCPNLPKTIVDEAGANVWVNAFQELKGIMDCWFAKNPKSEREFQQLLVRENNWSAISNESEYFVADIEFAESEIGARFDILALRWRVSERKNTTSFCPALIEMKYGDGALDGKSGIIEHLKNMEDLLSNSDKYLNLLKMMQIQFTQMDELGLLRFNKIKNWKTIDLENISKKPEIIFIFANHNPRSEKLSDILDNPKMKEYSKSEKFDLRFFVSSFAGYGLHTDCMLALDEFKKLCKTKKEAEKI